MSSNRKIFIIMIIVENNIEIFQLYSKNLKFIKAFNSVEKY